MLLDYFTHRAFTNPNEIEDEDEDFDLEDLIQQAADNPTLWETVVKDDGPGN